MRPNVVSEVLTLTLWRSSMFEILVAPFQDEAANA